MYADEAGGVIYEQGNITIVKNGQKSASQKLEMKVEKYVSYKD